MSGVVSRTLRFVADKIDEGSISSNPEETKQAIDALMAIVDKERKLSKYQACEYLNMSRASFDNYVRDGLIPQGEKVAGFKEKFWTVKTLDKFKDESNRGNNSSLHGNSGRKGSNRRGNRQMA